MARLSLYRSEKTNDYKFLDRNIKELFSVGGTDLYIHKYVGVNNPTGTKDKTLPVYDSLDPTNIQDILFLENRDRKYDTSIYRIRGHYNVQNLDFDLSQFGLFLNNDIIFVTVHYNEMIELIGRKLMVGDVFELPHLTDYHPLNDKIPVGLRRYYQITDANFASEGFSQTWYPHLWRIKCEPLVDSQEFSNILSAPLEQENYLGDWDQSKTYVPGYTVMYGNKLYTPIQDVPAGIAPTDPAYWELSDPDNDKLDTLQDVLSRYNTNIAINDKAIEEAARLVPKTGYDRSQLYVVPTFDGEPALPVNVLVPPGNPVPTRAVVQLFQSANYRNPSPVIRIGAQARKKLFELTSSDADALRQYISMSLQTAKLAPQRTESGSGQVDGTLVLTAKAVGAITGPYGTADNTYSTADQFPSFTITSLEVQAGVTTISVVDVTQDLVPGIDVGAHVISQSGTRFEVFASGTLVVSVDRINNTFVVDRPTLASMPIGTGITVAPSFTGTVTQQMDFRADCDPRFQFITRTTPQGFGYTDGYMIGDGTAPNGLPVGSGIVFPSAPSVGDYFLRTDYLPQLLYRWDGSLWVRISANVRAEGDVTSSDQTLLGSFINNTETTTLTDGTVIPQQQPLSTLLTIQPD
jgi:hypothetical protein